MPLRTPSHSGRGYRTSSVPVLGWSLWKRASGRPGWLSWLAYAHPWRWWPSSPGIQLCLPTVVMGRSEGSASSLQSSPADVRSRQMWTKDSLKDNEKTRKLGIDTAVYEGKKKKKGGRTRGPIEVPANWKYSATLNWTMKSICKHSLLLFIYLVSEALHVA